MRSILQLLLAAAVLTEVSAIPPWDHSSYRPPWWKPRPSKSLTRPGWPGWPTKPTSTKPPVVVVPSIKPTTPVVPGPASSSSAAASHVHPQPTGPVTPRPTGDGPIPPGFKYEPRLTDETKLTPGSRLVTLRTGPYRVKPGEVCYSIV